jgi:hypothetical protein
MPSSFRLSLVNRATVPLNADLAEVAAACQEFLAIVGARWDFMSTVEVATSTDILPFGPWPIVLYDTPDAQGVGDLGYHVNDWPSPSGRVFVKTCQDEGEDWRTVLMHEAAEMACDPTCSMTVTNPATGDAFSLEICDPDEDSDPFHVGPNHDIPAPNFVTKSWFGLGQSDVSFDFLGNIKAPFWLGASGYASIIRAGQPIDIYGSPQAEKVIKSRDCRGRRRERWKARARAMLGMNPALTTV